MISTASAELLLVPMSAKLDDLCQQRAPSWRGDALKGARDHAVSMGPSRPVRPLSRD
jgi:hypothetical protein